MVDDDAENADGEEETGFDEVLDWYGEQIEDRAEKFPGDMPKQAAAAVARNAAELQIIIKKAETAHADERIEEGPTPDDIAEALEKQALDVLAALSNLQREWGLDIERRFRTHRSQVEAMQQADSRDELQEAMDEAGMELEIIDPVEAGDNVDRDDYDPDDPDRGIQ